MNVTDADRKAAYALLIGSLSWFHAKPVLAGEMDENPVVQAFVRRSEQARREALEEAAKVAEWAHMVPPDGGSPTELEFEVAREAARRIRALIEKERT